MLKEWKARKPNYFFVVFGETYASQHPVDGGVYPHRKGFIDGSGLSAGDVLLLYCDRGHPGHDREAPGVGIVIGTETGGANEAIYYQYFPLDDGVSFDVIKKTIPGLRLPLNFIGN
jgi:hypothetical protein